MAQKRFILLSIVVRILVSVGVLAVAAGIFAALANSRPTAARTPTANMAPQVVVMEARPVEVRRQWDAFGTAQAMDSADVPARVTATVVGIPPGILAGNRVEKARVLVQLDDSDFLRQEEIATQSIADLRAQLTRLEIEQQSSQERLRLATEQVQLAQAEYDRVFDARQRGVAKDREVDQGRQALLEATRAKIAAREEHDKLPARRTSLQAQLQAQQAQQAIARQNVQRCRIVTPMTGILESVDVEVGENLAAGQRVARVVDPTRIEVPLRVASGARPHIRIGDEVTLRAAGDDARRWNAHVTRVAPVDDPSTRTTVVFVELEPDLPTDERLPPGLFVRGLLSSSTAERRWVVPRRALAGERILLVENGEIVSRGVAVAFHLERRFPGFRLLDEQWVALRDPLPDDARVVVTPSGALRDGMTVQPVPAAAVTPRDPDAEAGDRP